MGRAKVPLGRVLGKENEKGTFALYNRYIHAFVQRSATDVVFSFEDSVSAIMESVAVMLADELEDQGKAVLLPSLLRIANPSMGILLEFSFSDPCCFFPIDTLTLEENDNMSN